ncbi:hemoglobin alpha chain related protein [Neurospora crassa]|nr:hemoglobin alpha chain related protein [imported] - Neurospora crassa [Neurospora crassa]KHE87131.1 hemoglobin alpha chain related protein [Neurospora crassa]
MIPASFRQAICVYVHDTSQPHRRLSHKTERISALSTSAISSAHTNLSLLPAADCSRLGTAPVRWSFHDHRTVCLVSKHCQGKVKPSAVQQPTVLFNPVAGQ